MQTRRLRSRLKLQRLIDARAWHTHGLISTDQWLSVLHQIVNVLIVNLKVPHLEQVLVARRVEDMRKDRFDGQSEQARQLRTVLLRLAADFAGP